MAKRGRKKSGTSVSSYFREVFEQQPDWLESGTNKDVLTRWLEDHQEHKSVPKNVKTSMANVKSILRKAVRSGKMKASPISMDHSPMSSGTRPQSVSRNKMEGLEEKIDECLTLARVLDRDGLTSVIGKLRSARNEVVYRMGQ